MSTCDDCPITHLVDWLYVGILHLVLFIIIVAPLLCSFVEVLMQTQPHINTGYQCQLLSTLAAMVDIELQNPSKTRGLGCVRWHERSPGD